MLYSLRWNIKHYFLINLSCVGEEKKYNNTPRAVTFYVYADEALHRSSYSAAVSRLGSVGYFMSLSGIWTLLPKTFRKVIDLFELSSLYILTEFHLNSMQGLKWNFAPLDSELIKRVDVFMMRILFIVTCLLHLSGFSLWEEEGMNLMSVNWPSVQRCMSMQPALYFSLSGVSTE